MLWKCYAEGESTRSNIGAPWFAPPLALPAQGTWFSVMVGKTISGSENRAKPYLWLLPLLQREQLPLHPHPRMIHACPTLANPCAAFCTGLGFADSAAPHFPAAPDHRADHRQIFRHQCTQMGILSVLSHRDTVFNQALGRKQQP